MSLLEVRALSAYYGDLQALRDVSMRVAAGETVAIIGANGAGKSTLLRSIVGLTPSVRGSVVFDGITVDEMQAHRRARLGIALVPEGRRVFPGLSVDENLLIGADSGRRGPWTLTRVFELFPLLRHRRRARGGVLSGGEQQALSIGRALMANPRLLLLDEVSLGLAPIAVRGLYATLPAIVEEGTTVVVVEQDVRQALKVAARAYCLLEGRVSLEGAGGDLDQEAIIAAYFGLDSTPAGQRTPL